MSGIREYYSFTTITMLGAPSVQIRRHSDSRFVRIPPRERRAMYLQLAGAASDFDEIDILEVWFKRFELKAVPA